MSRWCIRFLVGILPLLFLGATGCQPAIFKHYDVVFTPDQPLNGTAQILVVGVTETELVRWKNNEVKNSVIPWTKTPDAKYWTYEFNDKNSAPVTLKSSDEHWAAWGTPQYLVVLASVPEPISSLKNAEGDANPERKVLPLNIWKWLGSPGELHVSVHRDSIECVTQLKPEK